MDATKILDLGASARQGDKAYQEDRFLIAEPGALEIEELALFAIFDGHGGNLASEHIRRNLPRHLDSQLARHPTEAYNQAIQDALLHEDEELSKAGALKVGSTVALALLNLKHGLLVTANLGDSHIVLASQSSLRPLRWHITRLSRAHKPTGKDEKRRIEAAGGKINYLDGARIGPVNLSRALGDHDLKQPLASSITEDFIRSNGPITEDLISNKAHTSTHVLPPGQSILLIASDGIGDEEQAEEAAVLAASEWDHDSSAQHIASKMTKHSTKWKDADNCTVIVAGLENRPEHEGGGR